MLAVVELLTILRAVMNAPFTVEKHIISLRANHIVELVAIVDLSPAAQFWVNLVLVWIGFGTLAGLLARSLLPTQEPTGAAATVLSGIVGSAVGLSLLGIALPGRQFNPISPLGLAAAAAGAFLLLAAYRVALQWMAPRKHSPPTNRAGERQ